MGFFGLRRKNKKVAEVKVDKPIIAIHKIRMSIENADRREAFLQHKIDNRLVPEAKKKMANGDKRGALFAMKRKKMYEAEIDKLENVKMNLETQAMQLETATHNQDTVQAMQTGYGAMKYLRKAIGLDKIDELMDGIRDEADTADEISKAIATPLDPYMMDDDELLRELECEMNGTSYKKQSSNGISSMFSMSSNKTRPTTTTATKTASTNHHGKMLMAA